MADLTDGTSIQMAAGDGALDTVRAFVAAGNVGPNSKDAAGYTAMHAAVSYGEAAVLRYLLSVGGDVNIVDEDGDTPLHVCETAECARLLLDAGAELTRQDGEGLTPYHIAVQEHRDEMTAFLEDAYAARGLEVPHVELAEGGDQDDEDDEGEGHGEDGEANAGNGDGGAGDDGQQAQA